MVSQFQLPFHSIPSDASRAFHSGNQKLEREDSLQLLHARLQYLLQGLENLYMLEAVFQEYQKLKLLAKIPGIYVPILYQPVYSSNGELIEIKPISTDIEIRPKIS